MNEQQNATGLRDDLIESARTGAATNNMFMPLCFFDYFESLPGYAQLNRDVVEDAGAGFACEELEFRLDFYNSFGAVFLDWIATQAYETKIDKSVRFEETIVNGETITTFQTPIGSLRQVLRPYPEQKTAFITEQLLKTEADARVYRYIVEAQTPVATPEAAERWLKLIGTSGIACHVDGGVPFHSILHLYGPERFLLMSFDLPDSVKQLVDAMHRQNLQIAAILADSPFSIIKHESSWDIGVLSPKLMQEHYVPYLREYSDILHASGKISMDHVSAHNIMPFQRQIEASGIDLLYGVEISAQNAGELAELAEEWRGRILMCLGISSVNIWADSKAEIETECGMIRKAFPDRSALFGTSDAMVPGADPEILAAAKAALTE